jgi:lactoylglutathione lyase
MGNFALEGLAHVGIFISDIEVSKKFYTEKLDFKVIQETSLSSPEGAIKIVFVQNGNLVIELVQFPVATKKADGWVDHIAIKTKNIEAAREELEKRGIVFEDKEITYAANVGKNGDKWIMFRGPDGEHLELNEEM